MRNKLRLEKRESVSTIRIVLTSILFTLIAFAFCGIIIASVGFNPLEVYGKMLNKVFLSGKGIRKMINASLPLMFCGLGVALTFKMNLNNVGFEAKALDAMRNIPVRMISFGGSNYNISFLIRECDKKVALQSLSDMLFNDK